MKRANILRLMLMLALTALLAAGCAKKTVPAPAAPPAAPAAVEEKQVVTETAPQEVPGIREQVVTEAPATAPELTAVPGLQRIHFDYDQYTLSDQAKATLAGNAAWLQGNQGARVVIEGHCDERGSDEYNLALGERRAKAAQSYLVSLGIAAGRLSTISYGEEQPLEAGQGEESWAKNRRAEFKLVK